MTLCANLSILSQIPFKPLTPLSDLIRLSTCRL